MSCIKRSITGASLLAGTWLEVQYLLPGTCLPVLACRYLLSGTSFLVPVLACRNLLAGTCTCTVDYPRRTSRPIVRISAAGLDVVSSHQLVILIHINHTGTVSWFPTLSLVDCQFYWCCVFIRRARNSFTDLQLFRFNGRAFHFSATL